jgi:hypothetical protein
MPKRPRARASRIAPQPMPQLWPTMTMRAERWALRAIKAARSRESRFHRCGWIIQASGPLVSLTARQIRSIPVTRRVDSEKPMMGTNTWRRAFVCPPRPRISPIGLLSVHVPRTGLHRRLKGKMTERRVARGVECDQRSQQQGSDECDGGFPADVLLTDKGAAMANASRGQRTNCLGLSDGSLFADDVLTRVVLPFTQSSAS